MTKINFLNKKFESERERNSFAFQEKETLLAERNYTIGKPLFVGFILGFILEIWNNSWLAFWFGVIGFPVIWNLTKFFEKKKINEYSIEHQDFLCKIEKDIRENIIIPFHKRYFSVEQKYEHLQDLVNLINNKKRLNLTEKDGQFILLQYEKEHNIDLFDKEISKLKDERISNLAQVLIKLSPETNFENQEEYVQILNQFIEYLDRKKIEYDIDELKKVLASEFKSIKATQFEEKLSRSPGKRITVDEIEQMDGFEFEKLIGDLFRKAGYKVTVTKKSRDQGADLIVERNGIATAIQTKKYTGSVGNTAVQEVVAAIKFYDCYRAMVITTGTFTKGAFELASRNGVQLIDKKGLDNLFDSVL